MKVGDKVRFLNAVGGGVVKRFQGKDIVYVEEEDGFETPVLARECMTVDSEMYPVLPDDVSEEEMLTSVDIQEAMNQKARADHPNCQPAQKPKDTGKTIVEVDLHINELLDTTAGMNNTDMLNVQLGKFRETMEQYRSKKEQKIVFIHGKGEGVLRNAILQELKTKYKKCPCWDASFKEYGFGATMVTIK